MKYEIQWKSLNLWSKVERKVLLSRVWWGFELLLWGRGSSARWSLSLGSRASAPPISHQRPAITYNIRKHREKTIYFRNKNTKRKEKKKKKKRNNPEGDDILQLTSSKTKLFLCFFVFLFHNFLFTIFYSLYLLCSFLFLDYFRNIKVPFLWFLWVSGRLWYRLPATFEEVFLACLESYGKSLRIEREVRLCRE